MFIIITILILIVVGVLIFFGGVLISKHKERWFIILGFMMILGAVVFPITTLLWTKAFNIKKIEDLGAYGDFFGGTTVGLLSVAGSCFLVSSIFLQMKSNKIQKDEMAKTNEQLNLQKKEFETTNITMIKQSFDSTFFSMLNLHHAILNDIKIENEDNIYKSRQAFKEMYKYLAQEKSRVIVENIFEKVISNEKNFLEFSKAISKYNYISFRMRQVREKSGFKKTALDIVRDEKHILIEGDNLSEWYEKWSKVDYTEDINKYVKNKEGIIDFYDSIKNKILEIMCYLPEESEIKSYYKSSKENISRTDRYKIYEIFYNKYEYLLAHYYKNLYRIVKYLEKYEFYADNPEKNEEAKRNYRGILRAQFSSYEFILLYFNLEYCSAGEKFRNLVGNKGFFDETLMNEDLMWKNNNF